MGWIGVALLERFVKCVPHVAWSFTNYKLFYGGQYIVNSNYNIDGTIDISLYDPVAKRLIARTYTCEGLLTEEDMTMFLFQQLKEMHEKLSKGE